MSTERTPLLADHHNGYDSSLGDLHSQFCLLVGVPSDDLPPGSQAPHPGPKSLYARAVRQRNRQMCTYIFTATLSNTLLLAQIVLGAALTGLGASASSHLLITLFGAANTIIAGVVAYLKSRGQPMRARMFRDDLERVVDEIENAAVMWRGISAGVHGYAAIDVDDAVTVRSEVARLTRLYDRAVRANSMNNPDMYMANGEFHGTQLSLKTTKQQLPLPQGAAPITTPEVPVAGQPALPAPSPELPATQPPPSPPVTDADASPATAPPNPPHNSTAEDAKKEPPPPEDKKTAPSPNAPEGNVKPEQPDQNDSTPAARPSSGAAAPENPKPASPPPAETPPAQPAPSQPAAPPPAAPQADPDESPATSAHPPKRKAEEPTDSPKASGSTAETHDAKDLNADKK